jgi:hypothetical protein
MKTSPNSSSPIPTIHRQSAYSRRSLVVAVCAALAGLTLGAFASPTFRRVVGPDILVDNVDTFASLNEALSSGGIVADAVIQIEPGAISSRLDSTVALNGLTIRGAASLDASDVAAIWINKNVSITGSNVRFENLQLVVESGFSLNVSGPSFTMARSVFVMNGAGTTGALLLNGTAATFSSNRMFLVPDNSGIAGTLAFISVDAATQTTFKDNFLIHSGTGVRPFIRYNVSGSKNDTYEGNRFYGPARAGGATTMITTSSSTPVSNIVFRDNAFFDPDSAGAAVSISSGCQGFLLEGNRFDFPTSSSIPAVTATVNSGATIGVTMRGNDFRGPLFTNVFLSGVATGTYNAKFEGNRFRGRAGVNFSGGSAVPGGIDLGGGALGSLGGNDFTAFTEPAATNTGALFMGLSAAATLKAQKNVFIGDPEIVIGDLNDVAGLADFDATNAFTGNTAFVASLYARFLARPADPSNPTDAGVFIASLGAGTKPRTVAEKIIRTPESLGRLVNDHYRDILGRTPSDIERTAAVTALQKKTKTEEKIITSLFASPEARIRYSADADFIAAIFARLLRRVPTDTEAVLFTKLTAKSRSRPVQVLIATAEFRALRTTLVFDDILRRTPTDAEKLRLKTKDRISQFAEAATILRTAL